MQQAAIPALLGQELQCSKVTNGGGGELIQAVLSGREGWEMTLESAG